MTTKPLVLNKTKVQDKAETKVYESSEIGKVIWELVKIEDIEKDYHRVRGDLSKVLGLDVAIFTEADCIPYLVEELLTYCTFHTKKVPLEAFLYSFQYKQLQFVLKHYRTTELFVMSMDKRLVLSLLKTLKEVE